MQFSGTDALKGRVTNDQGLWDLFSMLLSMRM